MAESIAKHMMVFKDSFYLELIAFLNAAEENGLTIVTDPNSTVIGMCEYTYVEVFDVSFIMQCIISRLSQIRWLHL